MSKLSSERNQEKLRMNSAFLWNHRTREFHKFTGSGQKCRPARGEATGRERKEGGRAEEMEARPVSQRAARYFPRLINGCDCVQHARERATYSSGWICIRQASLWETAYFSLGYSRALGCELLTRAKAHFQCVLASPPRPPRCHFDAWLCGAWPRVGPRVSSRINNCLNQPALWSPITERILGGWAAG